MPTQTGCLATAALQGCSEITAKTYAGMEVLLRGVLEIPLSSPQVPFAANQPGAGGRTGEEHKDSLRAQCKGG